MVKKENDEQHLLCGLQTKKKLGNLFITFMWVILLNRK